MRHTLTFLSLLLLTFAVSAQTPLLDQMHALKFAAYTDEAGLVCKSDETLLGGQCVFGNWKIGGRAAPPQTGVKWRRWFWVTTAADVVTSCYFLDRDFGLTEGNLLVFDTETGCREVATVNLGLIVAEWYFKSRDRKGASRDKWYRWPTALHGGAALWNVSKILEAIDDGKR